MELARRLAPLREEGVLILASGNIVHNLGRIDWSATDTGFDWAHRFDDAVADQLGRDPANVLDVVNHPDYKLAVPTPEHFVPLLYIAALASNEEPMRTVLRGYALGSISMSCYSVGADLSAPGAGAAAAPLPKDVPADNTNT
jgi:4,5-DOPA dioxygenase extradiol